MAFNRDSLVYLGGTIDMDGHITITALKGTPQVYVKNTSEILMMWLKENFGGNYYPAQEATERWKKYWRWSLSGDNAIALLREVYPFLLLKKKQALVAIDWQVMKEPNVKYGRHWKPTESELERRRILLNEVRLLNKVGRGV